jgi:glycosyltransferase involved in cell wall biosynthesis
LNILQISSASSFGGGERYVADLTNALTKRGHELYIAVRPNSPLPRHLRLPSERIVTLPLRNALDVQSARALDKFVRQQRIDIVHAHMARDYSLAAYAARRRETKFIVTRHVLFQLNRLHRHTLARATKVIAVSQAVARELRASGVANEQQIAVIPNGVDVERFNRARTEPQDGLLVGSIGELRTLKRHDDFIRAAAQVASRFPNAQFVLAGTGAGREELEELVVDLALEDKFRFLGWVEEAEQLLSEMDVFVSASETESFGLAIVEAMAAETAVVATATEGACEVIENQQTGLLVPIGNVDQIAAAVMSLLEDRDKREAIARRARQAANDRFSLTRMVDEIERIYLTTDDTDRNPDLKSV